MIVTQNTLKCAISRAKFQNFSGDGQSPSPDLTPCGEGDTSSATQRLPPSRNPGSATVQTAWLHIGRAYRLYNPDQDTPSPDHN